MAQVIYRLSPGIAPRPMQRDATSVAGRSADAAERQMRMNAEARQTPSEDEQILSERKRRKKVAKEARERTGQNPLDLTVQDWADRSADLGDMFRLFPDDPNSLIDDYLNPAVAIGSMASGLGQYPLNVSQGNYGEAALNLAAPILAGTVERGAEIAMPILADAFGQKLATSKLYSENIYPQIRNTKGYNFAIDLIEKPWRFNPFAYKVPEGMMVRGVGPKGVEDLLATGYARPLESGGYGNLYATQHLDAAAAFADDVVLRKNPLTGISTYNPRRGEILEFPRSVVDESQWVSTYTPNDEFWGKALGWPHTWSEYIKTPKSETFPGVSIDNVRILEPRRFMRYGESKASKQLRKQRNK